MTELKALAAEVITTVKEYVSKALDPVLRRVDEFDARLKALPTPEKGTPGKDGEVNYERIGEIVRATVSAAVGSLPVPKDGDPGKDAEVDYDKIGDIISLAVSKAVANIPVPKNGDPGKDAEIDYERVSEIAALIISDEVTKAVAGIPPARNGDPGKDADPAVLEELRLAVKDAKKDAESVAADLVDARSTIQRIETEVISLKAIPPPKDGNPGKDADPIHPDTLALMAREAADVAIAKAMAGVRLPKDGEPGRDALEMTFLQGIEETRSYPRGTVAVHNSSLIRAERVTGPVVNGLEEAGWRVLLEVPMVSIRHEDDLRTVSFIKRFPSGTEIVDQVVLPVLIDRGVWKEIEYKAGDVVSWDGSMWIAQKTTKDKPGTSDAWRLAVKRGRDGKSFDDPPKDSGPVRLK